MRKLKQKIKAKTNRMIAIAKTSRMEEHSKHNAVYNAENVQ